MKNLIAIALLSCFAFAGYAVPANGKAQMMKHHCGPHSHWDKMKHQCQCDEGFKKGQHNMCHHM